MSLPKTPSRGFGATRVEVRQDSEGGETALLLDGICPGIVFPKRPSDPERLKLIEDMFEEEAIAVVWEDESTEERKAR